MADPLADLTRADLRDVLADLLEAHVVAAGSALLTLMIDLEESIARLVDALGYGA